MESKDEWHETDVGNGTCHHSDYKMTVIDIDSIFYWA